MGAEERNTMRFASHLESKSAVEHLCLAREILVRGFQSSAGSVARSVLEAHVRRLCAWHGLDIKNHRSNIAAYLFRLKHGNVLNQDAVIELQRTASTRTSRVSIRSLP